MIKHVLLVGLGGLAGSISRYLLQQTILKHYVTIFPLGTFTVNMLGSLMIGLIFGLANRYAWMSQEIRLLLAVGFMGSFTTFSTFAFDNYILLREGNYGQFGGYAIASIIASITLALFGFLIGKG